MGDGRGARIGRIVPELLHSAIVTARFVTEHGSGRARAPVTPESLLAGLELRIQLCQGGFQHGTVLRIRRYFELLQDSLAGKLEPTAPLLFRDLFGRKQLALTLGRCGFFLLLLDRFAFPSAGHN